MRRALLLVAAALAGCSTLGDAGGSPDAYPHGGTGQFRTLEPAETGIRAGAIALQRATLDSAMVSEGYLFYAAAPLSETPPEPPMDLPAGEVFWEAFEARRIHRTEPRDARGFFPGPVIFEASEPWEGAEVFDPWVVLGEDGVVRMYYAAEGGIGLATAGAIDGAFQRVRSSPLLDEEDAIAGAPRRPSVVRGVDGAWWMYYDAGGAIGIARSEDGERFERIDGDPSTGAIDPLVLHGEDLGEVPEVSVGMPGAAALDTSAGRRLVRLYYESRREDGSIHAYVAGSADGVVFERHEIPVMEASHLLAPAPVLVDDRVTLLYAGIPATARFAMQGYPSRSLSAAVSPASVRFDPAE